MLRDFLRVIALSLVCGIFTLSSIQKGYSQPTTCNPAFGIVSDFDPGLKVCAPRTVSWRVTWRGLDKFNNYSARFNWQDGTNEVVPVYLVDSTFNPFDGFWYYDYATSTDPTIFNTHTYQDPAADCTYQPFAILVNLSTGNCPGTQQITDVTVWSSDDQRFGNLRIEESVTNVTTYQVCAGNSVTINFQDVSTWNCSPGSMAAIENDRQRWIRWIYGTTNTITGSGILVNGVAQTYPFSQGIQYVAPGNTNPVAPANTSLNITVPNDAQIGEIFDIELRNWNICNPWDANIFDALPPADTVNGDSMFVSTTARIEIIGPTPADAGGDQDICGNSTNFNGNNPATGTGTWTQLTGPTTATISNVNDPNSLVTVTATGAAIKTYTFEWATALGGCNTSRDTVEISFYRDPSNPNAGADQDICGLTTTMAGNNINRGTGQWVQTGGPAANPGLSSVFDRNATLDVSISGYGVYTFDWTANNPPCAQKTNEVVITFEQDPTDPDAGPDDTTVCNSLNYTMQGNAIAVGTGTWTKVSGPGGAITFAPNANDPNAVATLPTYGAFVLRWTATNGTICADETDDVSITAFQTPSISNAGNDSTHCGLSINLYADAPAVGTGTWFKIAGPGTPTFSNINDPNSTVTVSTATSYTFRWVISNGNCPTNGDNVIINFGPPADVADAGPDDSVCAISTYAMQGNSVTASGGTGQWTVIAGPDFGSVTFVDDTLPNTTMDWSGVTDPNGPATWTVLWTVTKPSCPTTVDTVLISVFPIPTPAVVTGLNPRVTCALTETLTANALTDGNGLWTQISGPGVSTFADDTNWTTGVTVTQSGFYEYKWEVVSGPCSPPSRDTLRVDFTSPTPSAAGNDTSVCAFVDTLKANTPLVGTGTWSVISAPAGGALNFDNVNDPGTRVEIDNVPPRVYGTYTLRWTITSGGCADQTDDVDITFFEDPTPPMAGVDFAVCANSTNMAANAITVGTGRWKQLSGPGTATIANINLETTLVTAAAFTDSAVYELEWASFNGVCDTLRDTVQVTFYETPTNPAAGTDIEVCATSTNLAGNAITVGVGTWTQITGPPTLTISNPNSETSPINISGFTLDSDTFLIEWASQNGNCPIERDTVQVIFNEDPTPSMAGTDIDICADTAILVGNAPTVGSGVWTQVSGLGGITIDNPNSNTTTIRNPTFGANDSSIYLMEWATSNGNCVVSRDTVQVVFFLEPTPVNAGSNDAICALTYTMGATPLTIGRGRWKTVSGPGTATFLAAADPTTDVTVTAYGLYQFRWVISNGPCPRDSADVLIRFDEFPSSASAGADDTICAITYTLNGNNPAVGTGEWSLVSGPGTATFVDSSVFNTDVTVSTIGTYEFEWRISNGVCADSADNVIIIFASSGGNTGVNGDTTQCIGATNEVYDVPFVPGTTYEWLIPPQVDSLFGGGTLDNFYVLEFNTAGTFTISVIPTNNFGCSSDTQTTEVTVYDFPTIDAGPDFGICSGDTVTLGGAPTASGGSGVFGYNWFPTSGLSDATAANPQAFPSFTRTYFLNVFDSISGCITQEDTAVVTVNSSPSSQLLALDPSICQGDSARLYINFPSGTGPFSVSISTGADTLVFPSVSNPDTLLVGPDSTVTYQVIALFDSATSCAGTTFVGAATVNVRSLPTATLSTTDSVICEGEVANLNIAVSGPAPQIYTVEYAINGEDTTAFNLIGGSSTIAVSPDSTTLYTLISVTDNFRGCRVDAPSTSFSDSVLITVDSLTRGVLNGGDTICAGDSAALVATLTDGDGPFTIVINNLGTVTNYNSGDTIWVKPTTTTVYSLASVTDTNSCVSTGGGLLTGSPLIVVNPTPIAQLIGTSTICLGDTAFLSVLVTIGTGPFTVEIDNGDTILNYNNLDPIPVSPTVTTSYNLVQVIDTFGCTTSAPSPDLTGNPLVTINPLPTAQVQQDDTICSGDDVTLTFSMTGQTPFSVTFRNNTTGEDSTISTVGSNTSRSIVLTPDTTTIYSIVSVTDGNGCTDSIGNPVNPTFGDSIEIVVRPVPAANLVADTTICAGETGHLFVNVTTGLAPYSVNIIGGVGLINNYNSGDTIFVSPTDTTAYYIISLTDSNGCGVVAGDTNLPDTVVFNVNPLPVADLFGDATICFGDSTPLQLTMGPFTGPYIVELNNGVTDSSYYSLDSIWVSPTTTLTYNIVKVTDSSTGCIILAPDANLTGSATVTVNPLPTAQVADDDTICFGETAILTFSMTGAAPFTVTYRDNRTMTDSTFVTSGLSTSRNITVAPLDTTIYSLVSVIDANGCVDSIGNPNNLTFGDSVTIMVRPEPAANFSVFADVDTICNGDVSYLTANLTVGVPPYQLIVNSGVGVVNNFNNGDSIMVNPSITTQYWIEQLTDSNGCVVMAGSLNLPDTVTIHVDPLPTADLSGDATICFGDSTPLVLAMGPTTGPFIVELDNGVFDSSYYDMDSIWVSPTTTTTYNIVRITDSITGCFLDAPDANLTGSATVTVNPLPTAQVADDDTICFGETAILTFSMTGAAPFTVTYRDNRTMTDSTFVTSGLSTSRNITVAPLDTTIYSLVSVIDANGCVDSIGNPNNLTFGDSVTIMVRPEPAANFSVFADVDTICNGDVSYLTANLTVGVPPYQLIVNSGVGVVNNFNNGDSIMVNPSITTQYWIEQLTDSNGCVVMAGSLNLPDTVTIHVDPLPTADLSGDATICFGDSTPLVLAMGPTTGPFIVELDNGVFDSSYYDMDSIWVSPTTTTTYNIVRITDSITGCFLDAPDANLTGSATVTVNPLPTAQIGVDDTICFDDNVVLTLSMTGQTPFTVTYRDNTLMRDSTITTIGTNTSHLVTVSPDSFTIYSLVSVIDGNGCVDSINNPINPLFGDSTSIWVDSLPVAEIVIDPATDTICNLDTAFLIVNVSTGPGPYNIQISGGVGTINGYISGTPIPVAASTTSSYRLTFLEDANGCSVIDGHPNIDTTVTVVVNPLPVVELKLSQNEICLGDSAQLFWTVAVGVDPIRVVIDDDPTDTISAGIMDSVWVSPTDTTTYSILYFEDGNGCSVSAPNPNISGSPTLVVNPLATASIFQDDTICYGENAELIFRIQGANPPYTVTYLDTGGVPITQFNVVDSTIRNWSLEPGLNTFTLTNVVDDKGCIANLSADTIVDILVHELPTVVISGDTSLCEGETGKLYFDLTGVGPFTVVYTNGITIDTAVVNGPRDSVEIDVTPSPIPYVYTVTELFDSNIPNACAATSLTGTATVLMYERARISWANGNDTTICDRDSYVLTFDVTGGRPTYTVNISTSDGITIDTTLTGVGDNSIFIVSPSDTTTYTIVSAIEEFTTELCEAIIVDDSVVTINVNQLPTVDVAIVGPTDVCDGDSITLEFNMTGQAPWDITYLTTYAGTLDTLGVTSNPLTLKVAPPFPGSYSVSVLSIADGHTPQCGVFAPDANITGVASFTTHGLPSASLNPLGLTTVCRGDTTNLLVVASGGTQPYRVFISDGGSNTIDTTFSSNTIILPVSPDNTTTFRIDSMMDSNGLTPAGCMADTANLTGQVLVTVNDRPTIGISGIDTVCSLESSSFDITLGGTGPWFVQYTDGTNVFPTVANASPHTVSIINPPVGTNVYKIVGVSDNGLVPQCPSDSLPTDSAIVHVNDLPAAVLSGDTTICEGDLLPLTLDFSVTTGPFTVRIVDGNGVPYVFTGLQFPTDQVLIPYTQTGIQTYFLDSLIDETTECEPLFTVGQAIVNIFPTVTVDISGSDTICDGTFGAGFLEFTFTDANGPAQGIFDVEILRNGLPSDTVFGIVTGTLYAAPDLQLGMNNYTVGFARYSIDPFCDLVPGTGADILVHPKPTATIQDDDSICFGSSTTLTFELTGTAPWDIRYLAGFVNVDTFTSLSTFLVPVSPDFTTTYSLVEVTDGNGCTESSFAPSDSTEATVTVFPLPTAQIRINGIFGNSANFCEEDTAALQVLLSGNGPFEVEIRDDLGNSYQRSNFNSGDTVQVFPPLGTPVMYWLHSVLDANVPACSPAQLLDSMTLLQEALPTADLSGDTTICLGDSAELAFVMTGNGPWTVTYTDGTFISQPFTINSSPYFLKVRPATTTEYKIFSVIDAGTQNLCAVDSAHPNVTGIVTVDVAPEVFAGFTYVDDGACGDPVFTFTDTTTPPNTYSYFWKFGDGDTSTAQNPVHQYNSLDTLNVMNYDVTLIVTTAVSPIGCTDSVVQTISVRPSITGYLNASADSGCAPLEITFESTGPAVTRYWDFENDGTDLQPGNPTVSHVFQNQGLTDLTYNVWHVVENQFACRDTIIYPIVVHPLPIPGFTANPQVQNWPIDPVSFTNTTANKNQMTYFWDFGDGLGASTATDPPDYTYNTWGQFEVVLTATSVNGCVDSFADIVEIIPELPIASLPGDTAVGCAPFTYTFTNNSQFGFTYEWRFTDGQTYFSDSVTRSFYTPGAQGAPSFIGVTLIVTGIGGFKDSVTQQVIAIVYPEPAAAFTTSFDTVFAPNNKVNFNNFSLYFDSLKWDFGDGTISSAVNPEHTFEREGEYEVFLIAYTDEGCTDTTSRPMVVKPTANIFVPNVFVPNPEGPNGGDISSATGQLINTVFYPVPNKPVKSLEFQIFNRWGEVIFESQDVNIGWDGYVNGRLATQSVYIYRVDVKFTDGSEETLIGDVTLLR